MRFVLLLCLLSAISAADPMDAVRIDAGHLYEHAMIAAKAVLASGPATPGPAPAGESVTIKQQREWNVAVRNYEPFADLSRTVAAIEKQAAVPGFHIDTQWLIQQSQGLLGLIHRVTTPKP